MELPLRAPAAEVEFDRDDQHLAGLSVDALLYMHDHGLALDSYLRRHAGHLRFVADDEYDFFEAMRLSERLKRVSGNIVRVGLRNDRLEAELVKRGIDGAFDRAK